MDQRRYTPDLRSTAPSVRFAAAKALALFRAPAISPALIERLSDADEHIFVSLEAAASLVKLGREEGWAYLQQSIKSPFAANRLETVIVLAELRSNPRPEPRC